jgi:hypothetical protein
MYDLAAALISLRPGATWSLNGLNWLDVSQTKPTEQECIEEMARLKSDYDSKEYQRLRKYPSIGEQLDMLYWDNVNGTTVWQNTIAAVKTEYPK